jgi:hypothetical protein
MKAYRLRDIYIAMLGLTIIMALFLLYRIVVPPDYQEDNHAVEAEEPAPFPKMILAEVDSNIKQDIEDIVDKNLFSSERKPPSGRRRVVSSEGEDGTTSFEGFELIGTILSDEDRSVALIRKGGIHGETKAYHLRDDIEGMALQEILYDRVILFKNNKEIALLLKPREEEKKAVAPIPNQKIHQRNLKPGASKSNQQSWTQKKRKGQ